MPDVPRARELGSTRWTYELVRATPFRLDWASAAVAFGQRQLSLGRAERAIELLREAQRLARGCHAVAVAHQADAVLSQVGAHSRPDTT